MTIEDAIRCLNERRYEGRTTWDKGGAWGRCVVTDGSRWLTHFETIAVAEALLRTELAHGPMPITPVAPTPADPDPIADLVDAVLTLNRHRHRRVSDWRLDRAFPGHVWSSAGPITDAEAMAAAQSYARHR